MSYRSFKRVLGETKLEWKLRFLFGGMLALLIGVSFWIYGRQTERQFDEQNQELVELIAEQKRNTGRLLVDQVLLAKHWEKLETIDVPKKGDSPTQTLGSASPGETPDPTAAPGSPLLSPTEERPKKKEGCEYAARGITENLSNQKCQWRAIIPDSPDEDGKPKDEFEARVLARFRAGRAGKEQEAGAPPWEDRPLPKKGEYQYFQPIYAEESCLLTCHRKAPGLSGTGWPESFPGTPIARSTAWNEGDLLAVVQVTIPDSPPKAPQPWNWAFLWAAAFIIGFLAMVAAYVIVRYVIVKPLKHLRDVSDEVSRGNIALRAEIHTGDEFEGLAVAFNRMLGHLIDAQEELRHVNADLDGKVDELAKLNVQLYEMNRLKSDFLATMSHELRTPLNSILGFSDVLASIDSLDDKQKRYVQNILKSGRTLLEMINEILDLAKMESGRMEPRPTDFRIGQVIGAQCDMARPLTEKKNIDLEVDIEPGLPEMHQDQARVQQILNNLLSNAIKFTPEGGRIVVSAARDDDSDELVMSVADTGVGIAGEDQKTVFEKFRQGRTAMPAGDAMTREYPGSGLGLSIVKELCRLLGGQVALKSELGQGSTFTIRLPWRLADHPRPESALAQGFEHFTKPRLEYFREHKPEIPAAQPTK